MDRKGANPIFELLIVLIPIVVSVAGILVLGYLEYLDRTTGIAIALTAIFLQYLLTRVLQWLRDRELNAAIAQIERRDAVDLTVELGSRNSVTQTIDALTYRLNGILLEIVAAPRNFRLFSADIYYSGQHL